MTTAQKYIIRVWEDIESEEPDISTERLIEMTRQRAKVSFDDVIDALEAEAEGKGFE